MILHDHFVVSRLGAVPSLVEWGVRLGLAGGIMLVGWITARQRAAAAGGKVAVS